MKHIFTLLMVFMVYACSQDNHAQKAVNPVKFDSLMSVSSQYILLDIRTEEEYNSGHLAKSINLDSYSDSFEFELLKLEKDYPIFIYCLSGERSSEASNFLRKNKYKVIELEGGISAWRQASLPIEGGFAVIKQISKTREQFLTELDSNQLYLIDFHAEWCLPCRELLPILNILDSVFADDLVIRRVNFDSQRQLAADFQVEGLPNILLIRNGKIIWSNFGKPTREELIAIINEKLAAF